MSFNTTYICYQKWENNKWSGEKELNEKQGKRVPGVRKMNPLPTGAYIMHIKLFSNVLMQCQARNRIKNGMQNRSPDQVSGSVALYASIDDGCTQT